MTGLLMSSCCPDQIAEAYTSRCPVSGSLGVAVDLLTVKALLSENALRRLCPSEYRFCQDAGCDVVYFSADGQRFTMGDVRVPVWQKLPFGSRPICYCFGESEASIRSEFESVGASSAVERIRAHVQAERCACEVRNPRGACCLGDVIAAVKRVEASVGIARVSAANSGYSNVGEEVMLARIGSRWAEMGALSAAGTVAATIFCCLPFAAGVIGAGVAAFGDRFAPLQPYLAAVSLSFLGYAFYQVYRPGAVVCHGERCEAPSSLRYRRLMVWILTVAVALLLTASRWANWVIYWTL